MPKRYFEMESDSPEESWRKVRALRLSPPVRMPASRQKLFTSSLEQAQQQFQAAAHVGFESRALNLYYGISQAGRAIAAALTPPKIGKSPEVSGHGLRVADFNSVTSKTFWQMKVRSEGNDDTSYGRLANILSSSSLEETVSMGEIWNMIPELHLDYPLGSFNQPRWIHNQYLSKEFPPETTLTLQATEEEMAGDAAQLRAVYPDLAGASVLKFRGGSYSDDNGIRTDEAVFSFEGLRNPARQLRGSAVLMPACGSTGKTLDPLLTWWIFLYALSMVTRYKPVVWTEIIDVNRSPLAVPLETLLGKALEAVPAQIHATLVSVDRTGMV
ncbi:YaaC family protein [Arthrobacter sp. HLT1-20]